MKTNHGIVYQEDGIYAGWPANHGAWQWGDEFLVGFLRGDYIEKSMHNIAEPFQKVHARSRDGGVTWKVEVPNLDFECAGPTTAPPTDFDLNAGSIIRVSGVYDHGGDDCIEPGGFYVSENKGKKWSGPYAFAGLEDQFEVSPLQCTSRTRVLDDLVFLSAANKYQWGTDYVFCARQTGAGFEFVSTVCDGPGRAVMPAVAQWGDTVVCVMRRKQKDAFKYGWVDACTSTDAGLTWSKPAQVGITGGRNGNPPALAVDAKGTFHCVYGNRDHGNIMVASSSDGAVWESQVLREGSKRHKDIGYPQVFSRTDGTFVAVYYWSDDTHPQQHIAYTRFEV